MEMEPIHYRPGFDVPPDSCTFRFQYGHNGENVYGVTLMWLDEDEEGQFTLSDAKSYTIAVRNLENRTFSVHLVNNDHTRIGLTVISPDVSGIESSIGVFPGGINIEPIVDEAIKRIIKSTVISILGRCDINWSSYLYDEWIQVEEKERSVMTLKSTEYLWKRKLEQDRRDLEETESSRGRTLH